MAIGVDFDALYRGSRDDVYSYVAGILRDASAAEEVTAEAFERAFRKRRTFALARGTPRAWLFGIARNAALDELRRRRRTEPVESPEDPGPSMDTTAEPATRRAFLAKALDGLGEREREIVRLRFDAGLTNGEAGRVLGMSESNVGTVLHRTLARLREELE